MLNFLQVFVNLVSYYLTHSGQMFLIREYKIRTLTINGLILTSTGFYLIIMEAHSELGKNGQNGYWALGKMG